MIIFSLETFHHRITKLFNFRLLVPWFLSIRTIWENIRIIRGNKVNLGQYKDNQEFFLQHGLLRGWLTQNLPKTKIGQIDKDNLEKISLGQFREILLGTVWENCTCPSRQKPQY